MCWACLWEDVDHCWLLVVLEATCKSVPFRTTISRDSEINVTEEIITVLCLYHWTSDFGPVETYSVIYSAIKSTEIPLFWPESFSFN